MKSSRLLALLMVLQRRRRATAPQLAEELEVSVRTLYRDLSALMQAGVPLWTEPGPRGGVRLMEGWKTSLDGLTHPEATALFISGAPKAVADLGQATVAVTARAKIDASLPEGLRARASSIRERFVVDAPGWFSRPEAVPALPEVAEAVWSSRRLTMRYGQPAVTRTLDPLGLVLKAGAWYLVARRRGEIRTYRLAKIHRARALAAGFDRPADFDLAAWWAESSAQFDRSMLRYRCRLRLSPRALHLFHRVVPNDAVGAMLAGAGAPDREGWREVALQLESEEVAAEQLTALGAGVEVLAPAPLRRRLHEVGRSLAARNAAGQARVPSLSRDRGPGELPSARRRMRTAAASPKPTASRHRPPGA